MRVLLLAVVLTQFLACSQNGALPPDAGSGADFAADLQSGMSDSRPDQLQPDKRPSLTWGRCDDPTWFEGYPAPSASVQCTTLKVPLDAANPAGASFDLRVARQLAKAPKGKAPVIVHIAGGPGVSSIAMAGTLLSYLPGLEAGFDHLYVDLRGTGFSDQLACSGNPPATKAQWKTCIDRLGERDLNHYLTVDAANDLEQVRQRLGYDKLILDGGSYGSRVVLEYMRQYPQNLSFVMMESLAPPDWKMFSASIENTDQAVKGLIDRCNKDDACKAVCPDLAADLVARRQALDANPRPIRVGGQLAEENGDTFAYFVALAVDLPSTYFKVPRAVHAALSGDNTLWNTIVSKAYGATVKDVSNLPKPAPQLKPLQPRRVHWPLGMGYMSDALYGVVLCAEWFPNESSIDDLKALESKQSWSPSSLVGLAEACSTFKVSPISAALRAPVTSSVKALLISGELDVRTPAALGTHTQATLSDATHLVVPYDGHADSMITNSCVNQIMTDFCLADGDITAVNTSCLQSLKQPSW